MKKLILLLSILSFSATAALSPYVGQQQRHIKSLSKQEIAGLLEGKGMGLAKAAELNHFPGPKHVLEISEKLNLSEEQLKNQLFNEMKNEAIEIGEKIIQKEQELDNLFAMQKVTADNLNEVLQVIGRLRAELRYVHLKTHLKQKVILSETQTKLYDELRGYNDPYKGHAGHQHHH